MTQATKRFISTIGKQAIAVPAQCEYYAAPATCGAKYDKNFQLCDINNLPEKAPGTVRFVVIADTHELHDKMGTLPAGDVLLHCGDFLEEDRCTPRHWSWQRAKAFFNWVEKQPMAHKVVIGGNHDAILERYGAEEVRKIAGPSTHYLEDELISLLGFNIYGTPRSTGTSLNRAFQGEQTWAKMPSKETPVDILMSHEPPTTAPMREFLEKVGVTTAHFNGHDHDDHGLQYALDDSKKVQDNDTDDDLSNGKRKCGPLPSWNGAILSGHFTTPEDPESLQRVTVVDLVPPQRHNAYGNSIPCRA